MKGIRWQCVLTFNLMCFPFKSIVCSYVRAAFSVFFFRCHSTCHCFNRIYRKPKANGGVKLNALNTFPFFIFANRLLTLIYNSALQMTSALLNELLPVFIFLFFSHSCTRCSHHRLLLFFLLPPSFAFPALLFHIHK